MARRLSWRMSCWILQLVVLRVCSKTLAYVRPVLNRICHWITCVRLKLWSRKPCWIIVSVSAALFPRLAQNLMHTPSFVWSSQVTYTTPNKRAWKRSTPTHLCATCHTDSLVMEILPYTDSSRWHNYCIDGSINPEYFGSHLVYLVSCGSVSSVWLSFVHYYWLIATHKTYWILSDLHNIVDPYKEQFLFYDFKLLLTKSILFSHLYPRSVDWHNICCKLALYFSYRQRSPTRLQINASAKSPSPSI